MGKQKRLQRGSDGSQVPARHQVYWEQLQKQQQQQLIRPTYQSFFFLEITSIWQEELCV